MEKNYKELVKGIKTSDPSIKGFVMIGHKSSKVEREVEKKNLWAFEENGWKYLYDTDGDGNEIISQKESEKHEEQEPAGADAAPPVPPAGDQELDF